MKTKPPTPKKNQYIIRSIIRDRYFCAIHSFTPFFSDISKARRFSSEEMAMAYARTELFTSDSVFAIVPVMEEDARK